MSEYETRTTRVPPVLREHNGRLYVQVIDGPLTLEAEIGPWFIEQLMSKYILPKLRKQ